MRADCALLDRDAVGAHAETRRTAADTDVRLLRQLGVEPHRLLLVAVVLFGDGAEGEVWVLGGW